MSVIADSVSSEIDSIGLWRAVALPSQGGTIAYLDKAFGSGLGAGSLNILLWISYIVMLSLYAYAFGSYGAELFPSSWHAVA